MDCERCIPIHGTGCSASCRDAAGRAICVFCADEVPCPIQFQILKQVRKPQETMSTQPQPVKTGTTDTLPAETSAHRCKAQGCKRTLAYNNVTGYCREHRKLGDPRRGRAHSTKTNRVIAGHHDDPPARQERSQQMTADRVNFVLAAIPLEDKLQFCSSWLAGKS
jgi:hypothetical protein